MYPLKLQDTLKAGQLSHTAMGASYSARPELEGPTVSASGNSGEMPVEQSACPVPEPYRNKAVYNVYSQRINDPACPIAGPSIDPRNNMPSEPNQQPAPGQREFISTSREQSGIPKGGTDSTWLYPSPQMFFNGARLLLPVYVSSMSNWQAGLMCLLQWSGIAVAERALCFCSAQTKGQGRWRG